MDIFTALGACVRRWFVFLPIVALVGFLVVNEVRSAEPLYTSTGRVIVLPPGTSSQEQVIPGQSVNVYALGGGRALVAEVSAANVMSDPVVESLRAAGASAAFLVTTGDLDGTLEVSVEGLSSDEVVRTVDLVVDASVEVVRQVQLEAGAPAQQLFTAQRLAPDSEPVGETPSVLRSAATIGVVGMALAVLAAVVVDALLLRRRRRTAELAVVDGAEGGEPVVDRRHEGAEKR